MKDRIYRYVVRYDAGAAPNPFGGWCSLAICKPVIRRSALVGDWIIGLRSCHPDQVIYVMQVEEILTFAAYWNDPRFADKRPDRCESSDNIYRPDGSGALIQVPNRAHRSHDVDHDLSGRRVLVGQRFWYFGDLSPELPTELHHLVHKRQGHSLPARRREDDGARMLEWLEAWRCGVHGKPLDRYRFQSDLRDPLPRQVSAAASSQQASRQFNHQGQPGRPGCA